MVETSNIEYKFGSGTRKDEGFAYFTQATCKFENDENGGELGK